VSKKKKKEEWRSSCDKFYEEKLIKIKYGEFWERINLK
jgi:hypothetical protein